MNLLRKILFPFSILYGFVTSIRNWLYDINVFKSQGYNVPIIAVGNLSVGGTGKTPQIEYLIRLLETKYSVATLSRGYKRETKGFILADKNVNAKIIGDEPFQFYNKFLNIKVAVDANRANGITKLLNLVDKPNVILLDDAFQHRKVKAGLYIMLSAFDDLYCNDFILPAGNLRESRAGVKRANIVVVTKCPMDLSVESQNKIKTKLKLNSNQQLFFTSIEYDDKVFNAFETKTVSSLKDIDKIVVAGIAKPLPFFNYLQSKPSEIMNFTDHHNFTDVDVKTILNKAKDEIIITTEKDYVRLKDKINSSNLYYLPIQTKFINNKNQFDKTILNYVG